MIFKKYVLQSNEYATEMYTAIEILFLQKK